MYKRILSIGLLAMSVSGAAYSQENAESLQNVKFGFGVDPGFSVLLQFDDKINLAIGNDGLTADYLLKSGSFDDPDIPFTWYVGAGGRLGWGDDKREYGVRLPLGLDWDFASDWNGYAQIHPELEYNDKKNDMELGLGAAVGIRYSF